MPHSLLRLHHVYALSLLFAAAHSVLCGNGPKHEIPYSPESYICQRSEKPILIDGRPDEPSWAKAPWTADFIDIEGKAKPQPTFRTRVKMLWDSDYFYFLAELEEPHLWATLTERDSVIFQDNDFEIFIDPDGDTHRYFEFEINALNTVWDLYLERPYRDKTKALNGWDIAGVKHAIHLNGTLNNSSDVDQSWTVEIAFPWKSLEEAKLKKQGPKPGEYWRVNFSRVQWRTEPNSGSYQKVINPQTGKRYPENNWVWSPQGHINMHMPERWGYVLFSNSLAGESIEPFEPDADEKIKWMLRLLYYAQKDYFKTQRRYTDDLAQLGLKRPKSIDLNWPPKIQYTWDQYQARIKSSDDSGYWNIAQDGRVWKTD